MTTSSVETPLRRVTNGTPIGKSSGQEERSFVSRFNLLLDCLIVSGKLIGVVDHTLDIFRTQTIVIVGDGDLVLVSGSFVFGADVEDSIDINFEGDFDLGNTTWSWRNSGEVEVSELVVILNHWSFSLVNYDGDGALAIGGSREHLTLLCWDDCVSGNELGHHSSNCLDSHREWVDIKKDDVSCVLNSSDNSSLNGSSVSNGLIRIDT
ncbi:hypothetical protein GCK72_006488 [Caenorhabditis remanei]|uniref:Uncharacterized protein n=1 Tax=Caenorhabditis remanei TaxID=31234 RepID=A0A6A5HHH7_CAERE|nr:hypothetical protein GCK72_006488 [Caenorhabditis remanei]KAF1766531.1 hypothetical protein GCK72_006488 [Caenorhabditis remanei]